MSLHVVISAYQLPLYMCFTELILLVVLVKSDVDKLIHIHFLFQINTNGFVSLDKPPAEQDYLGKMPAGFQMMAALLGDLDNSDGRGKVFFRQDSSPAVLSRVSQRIRQAFPRDDEEPSNALIVTWENMAAKGSTERGDRLDTKGNTFQLVVAFMKSSSVAILLYPRDGIHFFSTTVGGDSKVLEAGFNEGLVTSWWWGTKQGTYYQTTTDEEISIRTLTEKTNSGRRGVWVYEIGASPIFLGITSGILSTVPEESTTKPPITMLPRLPDEPQEVFMTPETQTTEAIPEEDQELLTVPPSSSETHTVTPEPETDEPEFSPVEPDPAGPRYTSPEQVRPIPPHPRPQHPQIVVVDEDEDLDINVFAYNLETCAHNRHKCSQFADCRDYSNGYCCHCRPGFYGNGKDCVAEGKPQRMNGKVSGRVFIGNSPLPVEFSNNDLHSYVVANDGRAYVAISNIPHSLGPSLQPLSSLGGVIGWAFALEQPGFHNGFSLVGGVFSRQADVVFYPGNERLSIRQQFKGIDEHDHLVVSTELEGRLPAIPLGSSVQINPYKEIYQYDQNLITSSSNRDYTITSPTGDLQTQSYQWRQTISFQSCPQDDASRTVPPTQQLSVDQIFVMFDTDNRLIRYAMSNKIGSVHSDVPEQNPCFTGRHGCDINAVCRPGEGLQFSCECTAGFAGDGRYCQDVDECRETPQVCGPNAICGNQPGTFRCECSAGFVFASDGRTCIEDSRPVDHCQRGTHTCDVSERALCRYTGGSSFDCSCLPGFEGDGRTCRDVDECHQDRCHRDAICTNTQGSYTCQCRPGFHGDGFQCSPTGNHEKTPCEREREHAQTASSSSTGFFSFFRPRPAVSQYVPQCDEHGAYEPTQCHTSIGQCWCVDANGQEIPNTRTGSSATTLCINQVVTPPPLIGPTPRPDVRPIAGGTHLLFAQSGRIEHIPLDGYDMKKDESKPLLHVPDRVVIAVAYDCVDKMVYWTDITGPAISKASLDGGDVVPVITTDLQSPEGIAIDHVARLLFWTDSMRDTIEVSKLDGSQRRVLFDNDLVNPRPIVTNPAYGRLYWADWNRDGPKIEMSNMDGTERVVLVKDDLGLPNGLTFDPDNQQLCWADAGTRKVECMDPHRRIRIKIAEGIQYPFGLVSFGKNLYYTDWRREAVISVDRYTQKETDQFQPQKRSRLYGIATTPTQCPQAYNYCSNNGGCSHLCLPRLGGFTCRCPDNVDGRCVDGNL
uniref:Nidogen 1b n=1 Tax=Sphaeramia orbicularis TaxID=375764 RepID=A0A673CCT6_9TELE